jgi:hypothetical protein
VARFTTRDVTRAANGVQDAGLNVAELRIEPDGSIHITTGTPQPAPSATPNEWERVEL